MASTHFTVSVYGTLQQPSGQQRTPHPLSDVVRLLLASVPLGAVSNNFQFQFRPRASRHSVQRAAEVPRSSCRADRSSSAACSVAECAHLAAVPGRGWSGRARVGTMPSATTTALAPGTTVFKTGSHTLLAPSLTTEAPVSDPAPQPNSRPELWPAPSHPKSGIRERRTCLALVSD